MFGKGPTGAKTYVLDDLVICVMRDGLTTVEKTLFEQGRGDAVREMRAAFQDAVSDRFTGVVEELTGRTGRRVHEPGARGAGPGDRGLLPRRRGGRERLA